MTMDKFSIQLTILVCLFVGNILFGSLPSIINRLIGHCSNVDEEWSRKIKWATFFLYVGAGVFISDSFLVLLPQVDIEFMDHSSKQSRNLTEAGEPSGHHHDSFPMPEFFVLCSFFLAYVVQETVFYVLAKLNKTSTDRATTDMRVSFCSCAKRHTECSRTFKDARPDQTLFGLDNNLETGNNTNTPAVPNIPREAEAAKSELLRSSILAQAVPVPNYGTVTNATEPVIDNPLPVLTPPLLLDDERRIVMEQHDETYQNKFLINGMLIVLALTLQYIFLGAHLGIQTKHSQVWPYLLTSCLQNFILTFSAGSYLTVGNIQFPHTVIFISWLSIVPSAGFLAVMIKSSILGRISDIAKGIVMAVACGTLLYTTFHEILRQKCSGSVIGLIKFLAVITGASVMIFFQYAALRFKQS